jgi:drug/metabolite transporter (DMT)-like permease
MVNRKLLVWLILSLIWGSTWLFIKLGLEDLPPVTFAGLRFLIASVILSALVLIRQSALPRRTADWWMLIASGLLQFAVNYSLLFWGEQHVSSGLASVLQAIIPGFGLVIAHFYLPAERMTLFRIAGVLLGIIGVATIFSDQLKSTGPKAFQGSVAIVAGAFAAAYSSVLVKAKLGHLDSSLIAAAQMIAGLIPMLLAGLILEGNPLLMRWTPLAIGSLLYLALVGSAVAFLLYYWLVRRMDVTHTMLISLVTPIIAVLLGMLTLREPFNWQIAIGTAAILSGIGVIVLEKNRAIGH